MMHLWITAPNNDHFIPGAMVAVPERQCLTYTAELIYHLRKGTIVHIYIVGPDGRQKEQWVHKCT